jgi:hypothetical protein
MAYKIKKKLKEKKVKYNLVGGNYDYSISFKIPNKIMKKGKIYIESYIEEKLAKEHKVPTEAVEIQEIR